MSSSQGKGKSQGKSQGKGRGKGKGQGKGSKISKPTMFVSALFKMVSSDDGSFARWSECGTQVILVNDEAVASAVLGRFFKHNKLSSLHRQLNIYGFRKISKPEVRNMVFVHPKFTAWSEDSLHEIVRVRAAKVKSGGAGSESAVSLHAAAVADQLDSLKRKRSQMENDLSSLTDDQKSLQDRLRATEADVKSLREELALTRDTTAAVKDTLMSLFRMLSAPGATPAAGSAPAGSASSLTTALTASASATAGLVPSAGRSAAASAASGVAPALPPPPAELAEALASMASTLSNATLPPRPLPRPSPGPLAPRGRRSGRSGSGRSARGSRGSKGSKGPKVVIPPRPGASAPSSAASSAASSTSGPESGGLAGAGDGRSSNPLSGFDLQSPAGLRSFLATPTGRLLHELITSPLSALVPQSSNKRLKTLDGSASSSLSIMNLLSPRVGLPSSSASASASASLPAHVPPSPQLSDELQAFLRSIASDDFTHPH